MQHGTSLAGVDGDAQGLGLEAGAVAVGGVSVERDDALVADGGGGYVPGTARQRVHR